MAIFPVHKAKSKLSELIRLALAGEEIFISRGGGEPDIQLVPAPKHRERRLGGLATETSYRMSADFNEPLADFESYES